MRGCATGERIVDDKHCSGPTYEPMLSQQVIPCSNGPCPTWSNWTPWTPCSQTCSNGKKERMRDCVTGESIVDDNYCSGSTDESMLSQEMILCNNGPCPMWSDWTPWTPCSQTCGHGEKERMRDCVTGESIVDDTHCWGSTDETMVSQEMIPCSNGPCPMWSNWTPWTPCSQTCGSGQKERMRDCVTGESIVDDMHCSGSTDESMLGQELMPCSNGPCKIYLLPIPSQR